MSAFLNLAFFVGVFSLIILFAGLPDRRTHPSAPGVDSAKEKRVA